MKRKQVVRRQLLTWLAESSSNEAQKQMPGMSSLRGFKAFGLTSRMTGAES